MSGISGLVRSIATQVCLRLIGGHPLAVAVRATAERLPITRSLIGGAAGLGSLLSKIAGGGLPAVFANPIGVVTSALQGQLTAAISPLTSALSAISPGIDLGDGSPVPLLSSAANALVGSVTALQSTIASVANVGNLLSGVARAADGQFGLTDVLDHASAIASLGTSIPAALGLPAVLGPLQLGPALEQFAAGLPGLIVRVSSGALSIADAQAAIDGFAAHVQGAMDASAAALTAGQSLAEDAGTVAVTAATLASGSPEIQAALRAILPADTVAVMDAALAPPVAPAP